jgi:N-acetylglucosamine transport system permease protein
VIKQGRYRFVVTFLALPVTIYAVFVVSPYLQTFWYSLTDWRGFSANAPFVGLRQYDRVLHDGVFWAALRHNGLLVLVVPVGTVALALLFAFLLNAGDRRRVRGIRGSGIYQVVFFFPQVLSVAVIAVLWQQVYRTDADGLLNRALIAVHLVDRNHPVLWLSDPRLVLWCIVFVTVWSAAGFYMLLLSAAMQAIPRDLYEAAMLDGAGRFHMLFRLTLPLLRDTIQVAWVYLAIVAMDSFAFVYIMTPDQGGPNHASEVMGTWIYATAFSRSQPAAAAAMAVLLFVLTLVLAGISLRVSRAERVEL